MKTLNRRNRAFRNLITWDTDREELEQRLVPATITVVNTNDSGPGSLRAAITTAASQSGEDTIQFDTVLFSIDKTITLASPLVVLDSSRVIISGPNTSVLTLYGNNNTGILKNNSDLILSDMVFSNGTGAGTFQSDNDYPNIRIAGGALYNTGSLSATNITVANSAANYGGGIFNTGDIKLQNSLIVNNAAITRVAMGGGIYNRGRMTIVQSTISKNGMSDVGSAGIYNAGLLTLVDSAVTENGKQYYDSSFGKFIQFNGGGIRIGSGNFNIVDWSSVKTTIINTTISNNLGGGIAVNNVFTDDLNIINSTISNNKNLGWAAIVGSGSRGNGITMINTICADNINYDLDPDGPIPNLPFPSDISYINFGLDSKNNLVGANDKRYPAQGLTNGLNGNYIGTSNNPISANISSLGLFGGATKSVIPSTSSIATHSGSYIAKLSSSLNSSSSTLSVINAKFLAVTNNSNSIIRIGDEQLRIQAVDLTNNLITVIRGINGTTATSHNISDQIYLATDQRGYQILERPNIGSTTRSDSNMTITPSKSSTIYGESVSFTIHVGSVTAAAGMPTGTLQLMDGSASLGNGTIDSSGNISFPISVLSGGSHTITAYYTGDWRFNASSTSITYIVNRASSTGNLSSSSSRTIYGDTVSYTTIVSSTAAGISVPSGTVQYYANMTLIGTSILDTNGVSRFSINNRSVGNHTLSSRYLGDINYSDSNSTSDILLTVTPAPLNLSIDNKIKTYGANIPTLTYTFSGLVAGDNVSVITGYPSTSGLSNSSVGNYTITQGTLTAGINYSVYFSNAILSIVPAQLSVSASNLSCPRGADIPILNYNYSGLVNGDTTDIFNGNLSTNATPHSTVGDYPITIGNLTAGKNYDINFTNGTLSIFKSHSQTLITSSVANLSYGHKIAIYVSVRNSDSDKVSVTGNVSVYDETRVLGDITLDSFGNGSIILSYMSTGVHNISASYSGDHNVLASKTYTPPTVQNLGVLGQNDTYSTARGVSDDGSVVIGTSFSNTTSSSFIWTTACGMANLDFAISNYGGISADGNIIVGKKSGETVIWTPSTSQALAYSFSPPIVSPDGGTIFGAHYFSSGYRSVKWTSSNGFQELGTLGGVSSNAYSSSFDGSIIVGASTNSSGVSRAFIYSTALGIRDLGVLPGGTRSSAIATSFSGNIIVGTSNINSGANHAFIWSAESGMQDLGVYKNFDSSDAYSVSPDGNYVFGHCYNSSDNSSMCYIWNRESGMKRLEDFLNDAGLDVTDWSFNSLYVPISGNSLSGYNFVGTGHYQGLLRAFLVQGLMPLAPMPLTIRVSKAVSSSIITCSSPSSIYGASLTYYTTVTPVAPGIGLPSGNVDFYDGTIKIGTASLDTSGVASLAYSNSVVGTHAISARYQGDSNFTNSNSTTDIGVTISKASLNVTGINSSKLYGANNPTFTYSYSGLVAGDTSSVFSGSLSTTATTTSPVGVYPINQGSLTAGTNYDINYTNGNLTVTPAALSVTISSTSKLYGAGLPNFSFNYSGFLNGDAPSLFSGSLTTTATANFSVGTYPISVGTLSAGPNYAIVPTNGTLIINPASLAVTGSNLSKSYGANLPDLKYSYSGLVNGDTESVFSGSLTTTATANSPVGSYPITVGSLAAGSNYNISFTNGTLSVTSSSLLVVTATNKTKVYGDILPTLSYTYSGLINGDTSAVFTGNLMTTATSESVVGIYGITQGNLSAGSNYAITFNNGTLTVTPATINVTASNSTKSYGGAIPALNYSYSGLVNGDTSSIFTGGLSTSASTSSGVGNYNITQGSLSAGNNYSIIYTNGTLSVTPATLSVSANNLTKTFGAAIPPLTYLYTGLVNNDSSSVFSGNLVTSATSSSVVANYPITLGNLSAGNNYNISFVNGTLSVIKSGSSTSISAPSTAVAGTNVTISASVTATAPDAGIPTGSVQFYDATTLIGTVAVNSNAQASIVTGSLSLGNHTLSAIYVGDSSFNTSTSGTANITIQAGALSIQSFSSDASAVTVKFNQAIATSSLQINDAYTGNTLTEVADLKVTDGNGQLVKGSMIVASDAKSVTFIKTGVAFANGTYTVRLRSGSNAFRNTSGEFLDGNNDGVAGGDYVTTFAVTNSSRVLSIPDVVRGPGQAIRVNTTELGVPVKVNDGNDIFAFEVSVNYDPVLMSVTDVVVPSNLSSFLQISFNSSVAGRIDVVGIAVNGLPGGSQNLFYVNGTVPNGVLYRSKAELSLSDVNLYKLDNSTISTTLDQGVQLVSYIGDVTGDGRYNALDPLRIQRYLVNLDRWFAQFPLVDPLLVADVTGDGKVNALDALYMQRYLVNLPVPYVSAPPVTSVTQSGLDPIIRLPKNLSAKRGQVVQVPVELQNTDSQAINVNSFEVAVQIDPQAFRLMKIKSSDKIRTHYDDVRGILIIAGILPEVTLQPGESMIICSLQIKISAHTKATDYVLNLLEDVTIGRAHYATSVNGGTLKLVPAPTNESNDSVDGNIRILERPNRFVSGEAVRKYPVLKRSRFGFITR